MSAIGITKPSIMHVNIYTYIYLYIKSVVGNLGGRLSLFLMKGNSNLVLPQISIWPTVFSFKKLNLCFDLHLEHSKWQNEFA